MTDTPFSADAREGNWRALGSEWFDLLVIGGGATGAGIARDAAGRGLRVALLDAGDFARGASGASSRLIHGGLRYLETADLRLVFEASAERRRLLRLAPHLVRPLPFLFPVFRGGPVGFRTLQAGMWLYDLLALFRNLRRHRMLGREETIAAEPGLRRGGLLGGARYYDAATDDARIALAAARGAHGSGARVVPHAEVVAFSRDGGALRRARVRDRIGGGETEIRARVTVNATGPWSDAVRRLADPAAPPRLRPTKGVHLMLGRKRLGNRGAVIFQSAVDGRTMFVLPWRGFTYVGTTDTDYTGPPEDAVAEAVDIRYLLDSANALFPAAKLRAGDVVSTWTGLRPLLAPLADSEATAGATSREHEVWRDPSGLLNVAGGKLTTFRVMAEETVDVAAEILQREHGIRSGDSRTADAPLPGAPRGSWDAFRGEVADRAAWLGLSRDVAEHLSSTYGSDARRILDRIGNRPALGERLVAELPYVWAEVEHAVNREMALTLEDVLRRRIHLFYEAPDGGLRVARAVARRMAGEPGIGWTDEQVRRQVDAYRAAVEESRGF